MITEETLSKEKEERIAKYITHLEEKIKTKEEQINSSNLEASEKEAKLAALNKDKEKRLKLKTIREEKRVKNILKTSKRIFEIDFLRGIVILGMFIDHTIYNFSDKGMFNLVFDFHGYTGALGWVGALNQFCTYFYDTPARIAIRFLGILLLFFLTGVSSAFSKNNIKRGLMITGFGLIITIALDIAAFASGSGGLFMVMCIITTLGLSILIYNGVKIFYNFLYKKYEESLFKKNKTENLIVEDGKLVHQKDPIALNKFYLITGLVIIGAWLLTTFLVYINEPYTSYEVAHGAVEGAKHTPLDYLSHIYLIFVGDGNHIGWDRIGVDGFTWANVDFVYILKVILGLRGFGFDWLGLFPFVGFTFIGGYIGLKYYRERRSIIYRLIDKDELTNKDYLNTKAGQLNLKLNLRLKFVNNLGRYSLYMYIFHQPMIYIFFGLLFLIFGAGFKF